MDRGELELDAPLPIDWLPELAAPASDPRRAITLRHVLNMSSGLYPVDSFGMEYATGSGLAYWAGASSARSARARSVSYGTVDVAATCSRAFIAGSCAIARRATPARAAETLRRLSA